MFYERLFIWSGKGDVGPEFFCLMLKELQREIICLFFMEEKT
jgi:hypothetical protein